MNLKTGTSVPQTPKRDKIEFLPGGLVFVDDDGGITYGLAELTTLGVKSTIRVNREAIPALIEQLQAVQCG